MKLLLDKQTSKKSVNKNKFIPVSLGRNGEIMPTVDVYDTLNIYERYIKERNECERIRLVLSVNSVCTNALFNPITEVVKNEGSDKVECLNYFANGKKFNTSIGKGTDYIWKYLDIIRDTQLSRDSKLLKDDEEDDACGYDYHCGIDIFSNHILRNITTKAVRYTSKTKYEKNEDGEYIFNPRFFNTIRDYLRDSEGLAVNGALTNKWNPESGGYFVPSPSQLYDKTNDILTFNESIEKNMIESNGWFGFNNKSSMPSNYVNFDNFEEESLDIYSVINGKKTRTSSLICILTGHCFPLCQNITV